jgi:hypothetical protein
MPLRDHFHPPLSKKASWEVLHGGWPMVIVQQLRSLLPGGYVAGPTVHHGAQIEVDIAAYERYSDEVERGLAGGSATATWVAPPDVLIETDLSRFDAYEVRVYDAEHDQRLVAAIEIVSPANKDRPERRNAFIGKCAALLQAGVAVSIVDIVTDRRFNLYNELMAFIGHPLPADDTNVPLYAASCRWVERNSKTYLESWSHALAIGQPLPQLPLWLAEALVVPLDLERSYEQACHDLWLT